MIGLLASKTVDSLEIGKSSRKKKSIFAESDSENEVSNLLPSNRKQKQMVSPKLNGVDQINIGPRCRAFIAFLVMLSLVGMVMLVSMAALGEFKEQLKAGGFHPIVQQSKDQEANVNSNSERDSVESVRDYRLPSSLTPQRYVLSLNVDTERLTCTGHVVITALCRIATHTIILHSSKNTINSTRVWTSDHREDIILKNVKMDPEKEFLILHLAEPLLVGKKYEIKIGFNGTISNEPRGFYRMTHVSKKGEDRNFFMTNLEPVYARRFFPCFDEPAMRSKFKVKVTHSDTWKSSSTMPVSRSVIDKNGLREVEFQETPSIPPYLLSLVICNMRRTGLVSKQGISINTFSPATDKKLTTFANGAVDKAIQLIERESKIKFPLPKVDIFLVNKRVSSQKNGFGQVILPIIDVGEPLQKFRFLQSLAEQLAKCWFQGIVGMKWWSDGWLMRSLAVHISHHAVLRHMEPGLNIGHFFYMEYTRPTLKRGQDIMGAITLNDVLNSTKSIEKSLNSCYEKKGASLIRMVRVLFGTKKFYKTVQSFLRSYHGKTVSIGEFFDSFPKHKKSLNMTLFMKTWVQEPGYPYVRLKYSKRRHKCYFTQSRFFSTRHQVREKNLLSPIWQIPLTIKLPKRRTRLLRMARRTVTFHLPTNFGWLKANVAQKGLYRVNYDSLMWKKIIREFSRSNSSFGELDRAGIIDDAFRLARASKLTFKVPLDLTSHLRDEKSSVVWRIALEHFEYLLKLFHGHKQINCVKKYLFGQAIHMTNSVGWLNQGSLLERMLRDKILSFAVEVGDKRTIAESKKLFYRILNSKERLSLPYGLKCLVFKTAIEFGGQKEWNAVVDLYKSQFSKEDKRLYLSAIASSKSTDAVESFLVNSFKFGNTSSELSSIIKELSTKPNKQNFAWKLIKNNWESHSISKDQLGEIVGRLVEGMKPGKVAKTALDMLSKHEELKHLHQKVENQLRHARNHVTQIERWLLTGKHGTNCH
ncbi:thyrotropin-releasing hormone-degrading ectoenzyme-like [Rhopilema esculentum]|uniref:thyrotropin-releasing hormone-degrading ectoenzyme-like n=1 Tax=Rhopilema esculentum TaxID=499914 RepID=UPI0031D1A919